MNLLLSIDFRKEKGGISRVAHMMAEAVQFQKVLSFLGEGQDVTTRYFKSNKLFFSIYAIFFILIRRPKLIVFDHLRVANILLFIPSKYLSKVVIFLHDVEAWSEVKGRHRVGLKKASLLLCNSSYTRNLFAENNIAFSNKAKVCLLGGVPTAFEQAPNGQSDNWTGGQPYCLFVSRLWKEHRFKGHYQLIDAFGLLHQRKKSELKLAIVGRGDDAKNVETYVETAGLSDWVRVYTNTNDDQLALLYSNCIALICPSEREGFGMVILEAMHFNKAAVALKGLPAEEIIVENETGKLLDSNDPEILAGLLLDIEDHKPEYLQLGEQAGIRYRQLFTSDHFKKRFLSLINEL